MRLCKDANNTPCTIKLMVQGVLHFKIIHYAAFCCPCNYPNRNKGLISSSYKVTAPSTSSLIVSKVLPVFQT